MSRAAALLAFTLLATACAGRPATPPTMLPARPVSADEAEAVVQAALTFRGVPYRNGGTDPRSGFDCSGLVQFVYAQAGVALPRETRYQYMTGRAIDRDDLEPGDLVFFRTVSDGASHVGIAVDRERFVHAPSSRGVVRVERLEAVYWASRYLGARRLR
jgi:cell wall-associated NlpC family hydrolase